MSCTGDAPLDNTGDGASVEITCDFVGASLEITGDFVGASVRIKWDSALSVVMSRNTGNKINIKGYNINCLLIPSPLVLFTYLIFFT